MSYKLAATEPFDNQVKRLAKKYSSLKGELQTLFSILAEVPEQGTNLGKGCYKIRLAIKFKGKGKSGGARVITHVHIAETTVFHLNIYDKGERDTLSDKELDALLELVR